jgi:hypothetical protein
VSTLFVGMLPLGDLTGWLQRIVSAVVVTFGVAVTVSAYLQATADRQAVA